MAAFTSLTLGAKLALAATAVSTVGQTVMAKKAAKEQKYANQVQTSQEQIRSRLARRRAAKEERQRRATLLAGATATGSQQSSGFLGASGALGTNYGQGIAQQKTEARSAFTISSANQRAADYMSRARTFGAFGDFAVSSYSFLKST